MIWFLLACSDSILVQKGQLSEGQTLQECQDEIDNDDDGFVDCEDQDCSVYEDCSSVTSEEGSLSGECEDGLDVISLLQGPICHSGFKRLN